jgi:hypothetical protein
MYVEPWLTSHTINVLWAPTGVGKSYMALYFSHCLLSAERFLKWDVVASPSVLYVDGELGDELLRIRNEKIERNVIFGDFPAEKFCFQTRDDDWKNINLADPGQRSRWDELVSGFDVIILDNLDTLCEPIYANQSDSMLWGSIRPWLLEWRNKGKCFFIIHHSNKSGAEMYGTSKIGNSCDNVVGLHPMDNFLPADAETGFRWHFSKMRECGKAHKQPLWIETVGSGYYDVRYQNFISFAADRVAEMGSLNDGEIAQVLKLDKETVGKLRKRGGRKKDDVGDIFQTDESESEDPIPF